LLGSTCPDFQKTGRVNELAHLANGILRPNLLHEPFHTHGTVNNSLILGVNGESQIANVPFQNELSLTNYLVKRCTIIYWPRIP
jgi:hypothetical protein